MEIAAAQAVDQASDQLSEEIYNGLDLGTDAFLEMLVAQLQYQDPLEPLSNQEMVLQLAQLASVEKMDSMSSSVDRMSETLRTLSTSARVGLSAGMIGRDVSYRLSGSDVVGAGTVEALKVEQGSPVLLIDGTEVPLDALISVREHSPAGTI